MGPMWASGLGPNWALVGLYLGPTWASPLGPWVGATPWPKTPPSGQRPPRHPGPGRPRMPLPRRRLPWPRGGAQPRPKGLGTRNPFQSPRARRGHIETRPTSPLTGPARKGPYRSSTHIPLLTGPAPKGLDRTGPEKERIETRLRASFSRPGTSHNIEARPTSPFDRTGPERVVTKLDPHPPLFPGQHLL